jgi:hypothetical protein
MQTNNKSVIITLSAILVAAFFMPWVKFFVSLSAWDMLFGEAGRYLDTGFKYIAILIPIAGALIIYGAAFNKENYPLSKQFLFLLPILTLIVIAVAIGAKIGDSGGRMRDSDVENVIKIFGIGFWLTLIASIILPFLNSQSVSKFPISNNQNIPTPTLSDNQSTQQTINQPNYTRPQVNINLPKVNWDDTFAKIKAFLSKYKVVLLSGAGALIAFLIVYNLFIKADPVKDAKNLAKNFCACSEELNKNNLISMQSYLTEFDTKKFKSRTDARNSLNNILQENQTKYNNCTQSANMKYTERLVDYNAKGGKNAYTFQQTYSSISGVCNNINSSDVVALQSQIDEKIKSIIEPEPDIEKIKADLIGQEIIGWRFAYLNEFKSAEILNTAKSNDRIEYQLKFNLIDNTTNSGEHDCQVMVVYLQSESGWYLSGVNLNYIIYTYTLYPDRYVQITPYQNCKWNADNSYKMSWKTSDWEYASETITGPDKGATTLPFSTTYFIKSLEPQEIKVKFTYRPNN